MKNIKEVFKRIEKQAEDAVKKKLSKAVSRLYKEIVDRTPVDSGNLHRNWEINWGNGFNNVSGNFPDVIKNAIDSAAYRLGDTIEIRNQTSYAYYVEYGKIGGNRFSKQAPAGMVRVSVMKFKQFLL